MAWVTSTKRLASTLGLPMKNILLVSPWKPSLITVTSRFITSPRFRTFFGDGIPWQTTWFTDVQIDFGNGG